MIFIKGFVVGIGKIIPGVSGAMLAINFKIYEKLLNAVTNFFDNWKDNLKTLLLFGLGVLLAIIICSNIILYLLTNYKFITMMFFIGLIMGGTYNFSHNIKYKLSNIIWIILVVLFLLFLSLFNFNNEYIFKNNFIDLIMFFLGGVIEIFASIVPGISATSLLMIMGIYDHVLKMISMVFSYSYVINNINLYVSYGLGMFFSFLINAYLISFLLKKYSNYMNTVILGLAISSIIYLIIITINIKITIIDFILGIMLLVLGLLISCILDK